MTEKLFDLTGFQRDVLYVIEGNNQPSGQDIKSDLERVLDEITHGRLYPNLDALVDKGLVDKGELDRRTNYYSLTDRGRDALVQRREWENRYFEPTEEDGETRLTADMV